MWPSFSETDWIHPLQAGRRVGKAWGSCLKKSAIDVTPVVEEAGTRCRAEFDVARPQNRFADNLDVLFGGVRRNRRRWRNRRLRPLLLAEPSSTPRQNFPAHCDRDAFSATPGLENPASRDGKAYSAVTNAYSRPSLPHFL